MKNVLRICSQQDPITLDPQKSGEPFSSAIIFLLFRGLTRLHEDYKISCDLADSYSISKDNKKYIFFLGEHFWSDGSPITAHDFIHSWKRALSPEFPLRATNFFNYIKNAEKAKKGKLPVNKVKVYAEDDYTLMVELEYPCPYFLELTSFCPFFPVSSKANEDEIYSICSGPFLLQHWQKGKEILLKKNRSCTGLTPIIDGIHIKIVADAREAFHLFEKDKLDWIGDPLSPLPINYLPALLTTKKIKPILGLTSCWFNTSSSPFKNVNLRKAFAYTVPREKVLRMLYLPNARLARRLIPSILQEAETVSGIKECPSTAKALFQTALDELGMDHLTLTFCYEATDEYSSLATLLKGQWEQLFNVSIHLEPLSFRALWQKLPQQQYEMTLFRPFSQYTDIVNSLERFEYKDVPRNFSGWENAKFQALLQQYRKTANQEKRQKLALKAEALLLNEMPIAPIYYYHFVYLQKPYVRNLSVSPVGMMQFDRVFLTESRKSSQENPFSIERIG